MGLALLALVRGYEFVPTALFTRFSVLPLLFLLLQPFAAIPLLIVRGAVWPVVCLVYATLCAGVTVIATVAAILQAVRIIDGTEVATAVQQFGCWIGVFGAAACLLLQLLLVVVLATLVYQEHAGAVTSALRRLRRPRRV